MSMIISSHQSSHEADPVTPDRRRRTNRLNYLPLLLSEMRLCAVFPLFRGGFRRVHCLACSAERGPYRPEMVEQQRHIFRPMGSLWHVATSKS